MRRIAAWEINISLNEKIKNVEKAVTPYSKIKVNATKNSIIAK